MPRQKLSEYRSKLIVSEALDLAYTGWSIDTEEPLADQLSDITSYHDALVVKVDEGVKGRFKQGLVLLDVAPDAVEQAITSLCDKGFRWLIIEPMMRHDQSLERYLSLTADRNSVTLRYTNQGGVDVEQQADSIQAVVLDDHADWQYLAEATGFSSTQLQALLATFRDNHFVFLEINPYVTADAGLQLLDLAVEVDDAAGFFVATWKSDDLRRHTAQRVTPEEMLVQELDANSPASLNLSVLEPNGSIFLLLSGGGASVVVADEVYNQGYGNQLGNYGEYSGNPNSEETYAYTKAVLQLLLKSSATPKVLFIGGAVANFTDIAKTFAGVMKAIDEVADQLREQQVKIFVRRGGPNQEVGLANLRALLEKHQLLGAVHDPSTPLTAAVSEALQEIPHE